MRKWGLCLTLLMVGTAAHATSFIDVPFSELVHEAPTVIRGKIGTSSSDWVQGEDGSRRIYTFYQVEVEEKFKGDVSGSIISVREMGGEKDGIGMQVAGAAQFTQGEDVVLLLSNENKDGSYEVRGLASGKFQLRRGEDGNECLSGFGLSAADGCMTLASLRKLVQKDGGISNPKIQSPSPVPRLSTTPEKVQLRHDESPAPRLQSPEPGEPGFFTRGRIWIFLLVLGLVGLFLVLRTKSK